MVYNQVGYEALLHYLIPADKVLNIFCKEAPANATIDNSTGELSFSVVGGQTDVDRVFINVTPGTLVNVEDEPQGANCEFGGVKIETGKDDNLNGVLDPVEVDNTSFVCNGAPGAPGPQGPEGDEGDEGPQGPAGEYKLIPIYKISKHIRVDADKFKPEIYTVPKTVPSLLKRFLYL